LVYVLRGEATFSDWNNVDHRISAGDMVVMPAGKRHGIQHDPDGRWAEAYVSFDGAFGDQLMRLGVLDANTSILKPGVEQSLVDRFDRILKQLQMLPDHALPTLLLEVHALIDEANQLHRKQFRPDRRQQMVDQACMLLSQNLETRIDIKSIAATLGISYERFRKIFRQRTGISPGEYRIRRRIDRARALIGQHHLSNKEVAYMLGYPDPFTFSKQFRKVTGQWPDQFRGPLVR